MSGMLRNPGKTGRLEGENITVLSRKEQKRAEKDGMFIPQPKVKQA